MPTPACPFRQRGPPDRQFSGDRNGEAIWIFIVSGLITAAMFAFTPALGKVGDVGTEYLDVLAQLRSGKWSAMSYDHVQGIVTFPSFHTTLGILFIYVVRRERWALAVFAPLNILLILSTPTVGGHYLVDLFGGAAVAAVSILVVRSLRQPIAEATLARMWRGYPMALLPSSLAGTAVALGLATAASGAPAGPEQIKVARAS
jgi:membrane-associated phospholipid phosphatase